jgi:hypothetical protein
MLLGSSKKASPCSDDDRIKRIPTEGHDNSNELKVISYFVATSINLLSCILFHCNHNHGADRVRTATSCSYILQSLACRARENHPNCSRDSLPISDSQDCQPKPMQPMWISPSRIVAFQLFLGAEAAILDNTIRKSVPCHRHTWQANN